MSSGVTVGFTSSVQAAASPVGEKAADTGPLGLFAALLDLVTGATTEPTSEPATGAPAEPAGQVIWSQNGMQFSVPQAPAAAGATDPATAEIAPALAAETIAAPGDAALAHVPDAPPTDSTVEPEPAAPGELSPETVTDLIDLLSALSDVADSSAPLDPALEKKLTDTLDAVATALGVPLPETPIVDPAISAAATIEGTVADAVDPLVAIDPVTQFSASAGEMAELPSPATSPLGAIRPAENDAPSRGVVATEPSAARVADDPAPDVPPLVTELADKLSKIAEAIETRAPAVAQRLEALATKLSSGEIDPALLARIGVLQKTADDLPEGEVAEAVARLLAPETIARPAAEPARFGAALLALPDLGSLPADTSRPDNTKAAPAPRGLLDTPPADGAKAEVRPTALATPETPREKPEALVRVAPSATADATTPAQNATVAPPTAQLPATDARVALAAYKAPAPQINLPQVAFEIVRQVQAGNSRFEIRIDPPELGRIDVKLDVDSAGNVNAKMTVDRAETLDLMHRDRHLLERALAQAGLDSSKTNLEFSLRQNSGRETFDLSSNGDHRGHHDHGGAHAPSDIASVSDTPTSVHRGHASAGGLNLFV